MRRYVRMAGHEIDRYVHYLNREGATEPTASRARARLESYHEWAEENDQILTPTQSAALSPEREVYEAIMDATRRLDDGEHGAPIAAVVGFAIDELPGNGTKVLTQFYDLLMAGELYQPRQKYVRVTSENVGLNGWIDRYVDGDRDE